jgi:hypothetical protein
MNNKEYMKINNPRMHVQKYITLLHQLLSQNKLIALLTFNTQNKPFLGWGVGCRTHILLVPVLKADFSSLSYSNSFSNIITI